MTSETDDKSSPALFLCVKMSVIGSGVAARPFLKWPQNIAL